MKSAAQITTSTLDGLTVTRVAYANLVAFGTAPAGQRPRSWTVTGRLGRWTLRGNWTVVKESALLRRRELASVLKALETGRA